MNYRLTILFFFFTPLVFGQNNLVPNPSFEVYIQCPTSDNQLHLASPWYSPSGTSTPDFYHECYTNGTWNMDVPQNWIGFQFPKSGQGYSGVCVWKGPAFVDTNYREYIAVKLIDSLKEGKKYIVSFYVSLADTVWIATDDFGMYISVDSIHFIGGGPAPFSTQINNLSGSFLVDRENWMLITGEYFAQGGERYICIGNFKNLSSTDTLFVPGGVGPQDPTAYYGISYYYIDDVSLYEDTISRINEFIDLNHINVYPIPATNELTINLTSPDKYYFNLFDLLGAIRLFASLDSNSKTVDLTSVDSGVYVFTIVDCKGDVIKTDKLIIIK